MNSLCTCTVVCICVRVRVLDKENAYIRSIERIFVYIKIVEAMKRQSVIEFKKINNNIIIILVLDVIVPIIAYVL